MRTGIVGEEILNGSFLVRRQGRLGFPRWLSGRWGGADGWTAYIASERARDEAFELNLNVGFARSGKACPSRGISHEHCSSRLPSCPRQ
jgi:hypothetical protein